MPQAAASKGGILNPSLTKPIFDQLEEVITLNDLFVYFVLSSLP